MPVVLDNDAGERVLLYGADGSTLRKVIVDSSGRLIIVGAGAGGAVTVTQTTPANLTPGIYVWTGVAWIQAASDAAGRLHLASEISTAPAYVTQTDPTKLTAAAYGVNGSTQKQIAVDASARVFVAQPEERNPVLVTKNYAANGVGPHADTQRWTYTVPNGKKARVEALNLHITRDAVATGVALSEFYVQYTPSGGANVRVLQAEIFSVTAGQLDGRNDGYALFMGAGDQIEGRTSDGSTGGTVRYVGGMKATEYDA